MEVKLKIMLSTYFTFELSPIIEAALNFCHENQNIPLIYNIGYKNITQLHINA